MTKTQVKARLKKLVEQLSNIRDELYQLQFEVEETAENIEPYEGLYELTLEQEERKDWFEEAASAIEESADKIEEIESELEDR